MDEPTPVNIALSDGSVTIVDSDAAVMLAGLRLSPHSKGYVRCGSQYLHRIIMSAQPGQLVDHINGDKRDNRRRNLRLCSHAENLWNAGAKKHSKTGLKGVYRCSTTGRWRAEIRANGRCIKIGRFKTPEAASSAYDAAARSLHANFARANCERAGKGCGA